MEIKELSKKGYKCIKCANHKVEVSNGGFNVDINCKLHEVSIFLIREDIIKDCKNFITNEQYKRKRKLNKITDKTNERNRSRIHKITRGK